MTNKWSRIRKIKARNKTLFDVTYNQIRDSPPAQYCWLDGLWGMVAWTNTLIIEGINHPMEEAMHERIKMARSNSKS